MNDEYANAHEEHQHHTYSSHVIPWYVRLIWILFWIYVIYYTIRYFVPAIDVELISPP